ncbi:MAG TPA: RluA family pseudouridine synthase [Syntrophorhabdaceae bacterium]|jgi:23S rRNA pseudouridine1911/1915/1917 synthase
MDETRFTIIVNGEGKRIDLFLSEKLSITRTKVKNMIEAGHVRVDGKPPKPSAKLKKGTLLEGEMEQEEPLTLTPESIPLDILYEDPYLLAINKPKDMVVHPSPGHWSGTLVNAILGYMGGVIPFLANGEEEEDENSEGEGEATEFPPIFFRPGIVHRLDKGTTGVIIIAKDGKTGEQLSSLFKNREITKTYRAIAEGTPVKSEGTIKGAIGRHPVDRKKMAVLKDKGREAETGYKVLKKLKGFSYVEAYPKTGRTHQIRVHLASIGHPVVGDDAYGKKARSLADRPLLHAYSITFIHPATGEKLVVTAPVPEDMEEFITSHEI